MSNPVLPDPAPHARLVTDIVRAAVEEIPWIGAGVKLLIERRMADAQRILIEQIELNGITYLHGLTDAQRDFLLPSVYRFIEQARLGDYIHNLRILAALIAGELSNCNQAPDVGRIARAARRLDTMTFETLQALSRCPRAFEIYRNSEEYKGYYLCIGSEDLVDSYKEIGVEISHEVANEVLSELTSRGILAAGGRAGRIGGIYYFMTQAYNEIIEDVSRITGNEDQN